MALAKSQNFYCNGIDLAANAIKEYTATADREELDTTTLGSSMRSYVAGFQTGNLNATGVWQYDQTNADEIHNIFSGAMTTGSEAVITATLATAAVGVDTIMMNAVETSFGIETPLGQLIMVTADFRATTGLNFGKWLFNAEVDTTTTNGTSVDNGSATTNGGLFQVHYQSGAGTEDLTAKIQHSTDNSTWADLGTITLSNLSGFGASSLEVAASTTVNRYIRAQIAVAQGALTVQAAFARR